MQPDRSHHTAAGLERLRSASAQNIEKKLAAMIAGQRRARAEKAAKKLALHPVKAPSPEPCSAIETYRREKIAASERSAPIMAQARAQLAVAESDWLWHRSKRGRGKSGVVSGADGTQERT